MKLEMLMEQLMTAAEVQVAMELKVCTHKLQYLGSHAHTVVHAETKLS